MVFEIFKKAKNFFYKKGNLIRRKSTANQSRKKRVVATFTLIEVLVAIWILGTSLVALVGLHIGNIKFAQKIDEISTALFLTLDTPYERYLEEKYNIDIPPREIPENYRIEEDIFDFSALATSVAPVLSVLNLPPLPVVRIYTPSDTSIEVFGKMKLTTTRIRKR